MRKLMIRLVLLFFVVLALTGCPENGDEPDPPPPPDRNGNGGTDDPPKPRQRLGGRGVHGIGTTLDYITYFEDDAAEFDVSFEYLRHDTYRGRPVVVIAVYGPMANYNWPCPVAYWDLETGNTVACLDEFGGITAEWLPHRGMFEFPMTEGLRPPWGYTLLNHYAGEAYENVETWTVEECGIEIEIFAGTFTVCRQSLARASWDPFVEWIEWYDPENNLRVASYFNGTVIELWDYELVE